MATDLLQSALQPLWVLACSTIFEYSQQEGFYRAPLPAACQTPQPGGPVIRTFRLLPQGVPSVWRRKRRWNYGREIAENLAKSGDFHVTFGFFLHAVNLRHGTDGFTSPPKEGALRIFFRPKNPTASAGFEPANSGTKGQHAHLQTTKPLPSNHLHSLIIPDILIYRTIRGMRTPALTSVDASVLNEKPQCVSPTVHSLPSNVTYKFSAISFIPLLTLFAFLPTLLPPFKIPFFIRSIHLLRFLLLEALVYTSRQNSFWRILSTKQYFLSADLPRMTQE